MPVYQFGKLTSKYIIYDIFTHSYSKSDLMELLWSISRSLRKLSVNEYEMAQDFKFNLLQINFKDDSDWLQDLLKPISYKEFNDYKIFISSSHYLKPLASFIRPWHQVKELDLPCWDRNCEV